MKQTVRICVIGAGPSGIAACKNCLEFGLDVVVFEKNSKVGGNWVFNAATGHSSVYENTHIISSKTLSEYEDYPMPTDYPDYPGHQQLQAYFESYARHFNVYQHIRFGHTVDLVTREPDSGNGGGDGGGGWRVDFHDADGVARSERFTHLMVSNGHHWNPKYPEYPGTFSGKTMHSHDFKGVDDTWRGKDVLVIGGGNSACDVAVESARVAGAVCLSMRRPQWFLPKLMFGMPTDFFGSRYFALPTAVRNFTTSVMIRTLQGSFKKYGLPVPTGRVFDSHPTINSDLLDFIRHGRVKPRPAVQRLDGEFVVFADGRRERFDILCACTGFWTTFPFFDKSFIDFQHVEKVPLYRKMMHADHPTLYFIGLFQPLGCIWPMADYQAKLACAEIVGRYQRPPDMQAAIRHELAHPHFPFEGGQRHAVEVDYASFRNELKSDLKQAGIDIGRMPLGVASRYKRFAVPEGASTPK
jgi:Flavin-binding monooxygenase-like